MSVSWRPCFSGAALLCTLAVARLVLVGEAPSRTQDFTRAVESRLTKRLAAMADVELSEFLAGTERRNVLQDWPGPQGKGGAFPMYRARREAQDMRMVLLGRRVVLLGSRVATAFGLARLGVLRWHVIGHDGAGYAVLPHPSGVNRWYNNPDNMEAARAFLRAAWEGR